MEGTLPHELLKRSAPEERAEITPCGTDAAKTTAQPHKGRDQESHLFNKQWEGGRARWNSSGVLKADLESSTEDAYSLFWNQLARTRNATKLKGNSDDIKEGGSE